MAQSGPARRIHGAAHPQHRAVELREPIRVLNGSLSLANAGEACQRLHAGAIPVDSSEACSSRNSESRPVKNGLRRSGACHASGAVGGSRDNVNGGVGDRSAGSRPSSSARRRRAAGCGTTVPCSHLLMLRAETPAASASLSCERPSARRRSRRSRPMLLMLRGYRARAAFKWAAASEPARVRPPRLSALDIKGAGGAR